MSYMLTIRPLGSVSTLRVPYASLADATQDMEDALRKGYYRTPKILMMLGDGTCLSLLSDEEAARLDAADRVAAQSGGLHVQDRYISNNPEGFVLHIQLETNSMPPLFFDTDAEVVAIIDAAIEQRFLKHVFKPDHDYIYLKLGAGMMFIKMSVAEFTAQRRAQAEQRQRQANAQQGGGKPRIIM